MNKKDLLYIILDIEIVLFTIELGVFIAIKMI